jgi:hypothetical protein
MKTIIALMMILGAFAVQAQDMPTKFEKCTDGDMRLMEASMSLDEGAVKRFIQDEVLPKKSTCMVSKPRYIHPAVCGTQITQIDTFVINTENRASYTVVVDSSYRSCLRYRRIPVIKSMKYEQMPRPEYLDN